MFASKLLMLEKLAMPLLLLLLRLQLPLQLLLALEAALVPEGASVLGKRPGGW